MQHIYFIIRTKTLIAQYSVITATAIITAMSMEEYILPPLAKSS
jgi:hypothetical protein